jgi:hypothetical protein
MKSKKAWDTSIKVLPRKSRVARHLAIYDYINKQENIRLVPVHVARGHGASVDVHPSKNPTAPVMIKKSDPNKDFPYFTSDVAQTLGKSQSFIAKMARDIGIRSNGEYCYLYKMKSGQYPKYSEKGLGYFQSYLDQHPKYTPYKKKTLPRATSK